MCADASLARSLLFALGSSVLGCHASATATVVEHVEPTQVESIAPGERCLPYSGPPSDPSLRGLARTHAVRCCPSDYGFDAELARDACGFAEYLGESEELACVQRFRASDGQLHELRISPIVDLTIERAVALHELSTGPTQSPAEQPDIRWSAVDGRRWALVPGWSIVRRLAWDEAACAPERMLPVLARMRAAADDPAAAIALPRLLDEQRPNSSTLASASLLERSFEPAQPGRHFPLPRSAEALVDQLLRAAIVGEFDRFAALLEPEARIGLPDRRQLGARAMLGGDGLAASVQLLRDAAARLPIDAELRCPALDRRVEPQVMRGEALMWCLFISDDGLDLLAFGLRGRVLDDEADARVAYVGVFPVRPEAPLTVPGEPPPPPVVPEPQLLCGDPHARAYPQQCPAAERGEDEPSLP